MLVLSEQVLFSFLCASLAKINFGHSEVLIFVTHCDSEKIFLNLGRIRG